MTSVRSGFVDRHIGPSQEQIDLMLLQLGFKDLESFTAAVVPASIAMTTKLQSVLPEAASEVSTIEELRTIASENSLFRSFIGTGYYGTITPPVVLRNVLENPAWYTAYTPYQQEISEGRLEALFAFQTMISDLTGLPISNASMLDEGTAAAEAMTLAHRQWKGSDDAIFYIDSRLHPQSIAVIQTRAKPLHLNVSVVDVFTHDLSNAFGLIVQYPDTYGTTRNLDSLVKKVHDAGALVVAATDLLALTLLKSPGEWGCDVAVGSAQRFGVPMGFGGPHAGFMSVRQGLERSLPGRLVGQSVDSHGNAALRLALQTREQHIRRDKATSNICTAQVLLAVISAFYAAWHGPQGLIAIAKRVRTYATSFAASLSQSEYKVVTENIFDTVHIATSKGEELINSAKAKRINLRRTNEGVALSFDETVTDKDLADLYEIFSVKKATEISHDNFSSDLSRKSAFLQHPIFNTYHSETAMLRYLRTLADRDLALDRTMIPLGSCTMKLNATTEMEPITWPEFSALHPFAPAEQTQGSRRLIAQLSDWLVAITGYDAVSLQPNAGSQGEFAGLLAIRNYLNKNGGSERDICLIPSLARFAQQFRMQAVRFMSTEQISMR